MIGLGVCVIFFLGGAIGCRPQVQPIVVVDAAPSIDAPTPPPNAPPTPAAVKYFSDIPDDLEGQDLVAALHSKLRDDHLSVSFAGRFDAYETLDRNRNGCAGIFDYYSSKCWDSAQACGNYTKEGDCFNREHSWPKTWWGGGGSGPSQYKDLVAVVPADGYVNNKRGELPLGTVVSGTYTSSNGSRRGLCNAPGSAPGTKCFEPPDSLKGDFARIYFYMAVRYEGEFDCCDTEATVGADIKPWQEDMLRIWHTLDPVDIWERNRNEAVFGIQKNRNPFVDYPSYVDRIFDF